MDIEDGIVVLLVVLFTSIVTTGVTINTTENNMNKKHAIVLQEKDNEISKLKTEIRILETKLEYERRK